MKRTIKQLIEAGQLSEKFSVLLVDGTLVEGFLVQERVDKTKDTEGYNVYDFRSGEAENGIELACATIEPNVCVNWSDSIATKQSLDFGNDGYLEIDNSDLLDDKEYVLEELLLGLGEYDEDEVLEMISEQTEEDAEFVSAEDDANQPGYEMFGNRIDATYSTESFLIHIHYYENDNEIDFVEVTKK